MIGEIIQMTNDDGKVIFGILVKINKVSDGKMFIPCNSLLLQLKKRELNNTPLIPEKPLRIEIKILED